jgi:trigger factor
MKKKILCSLLAAAMILSLTACVRSGQPPEERDPEDTSGETTQPITPSGDEPFPGFYDQTPDEIPRFASINLDEHGYWEGLTALDHVEKFKYNGIEVPKNIFDITDKMIDDEIARVEAAPPWQPIEPDYPEKYFIFDRAVKDKDRVNIDYIGSVDGVPFEGGNSFAGENESGFLVTAGTPAFIDDFLWQIIGMNPGETKDVVVSFPAEYPQNPDLAGKEAVFVTTINHIVDNRQYWYDVLKEEMDDCDDTRKDAIRKFIEEEIFTNEVVYTVPEFFRALITDATILQFKQYANEAGATMSYFISDYMELQGGWDAFLEYIKEGDDKSARIQLIYQAIAEDMELVITDEMAFEFMDSIGLEGEDVHNDMEELYGMPFIKSVAMHDFILEYMIENAVFV